MAEQLANNASGTLSANMLIGATSLTLNAGQGAAFPSTGNFRILIGSELILVGARSTDTLSSLTRGIEGTAAAAHNSGDAVKLELTAGGLLQFIQDNSVQKSASIASGEFEVYNGTTWARSTVTPAAVAGLAPGANGQYLTTAGGVTTWSTAPVIAPTFLPGIFSVAHAASALTASTAYLIPIPNVVIATSISRICFRESVQSGNMDVGIYYSDDELTFTRLFATGSFAAPAAGQIEKAITATVITPVTGRRWYYAMAIDNGTASVGVIDGTTHFQGLTWKKATSFPLPSSITSATTGAGAAVPVLHGAI